MNVLNGIIHWSVKADVWHSLVAYCALFRKPDTGETDEDDANDAGDEDYDPDLIASEVGPLLFARVSSNIIAAVVATIQGAGSDQGSGCAEAAASPS